ncbi:TOG array regulator of axonemal microtubules protein 1 isoform X5 [Astyanax mexicanus]|uniref:TOG array regulator of axonemal microtubules protein 1 isoform X2 n=1 Tax=Astyanax mexicanus TaxID=7994 RepID=UPI0020CB5476|nr:TOG array regulator of axonemal microtubules protein 1 isoform X2 [Astyanax mexicanus]XP_049341280.1 TOG array regulator of axonemal microtubules protein 1 isoform X3 [Astyanax mexicanus]XP_049341281.1 TOG array regulator of axonemal microtubules protein 1 isoform X5 [Astyanax mexicanus]
MDFRENFEPFFPPLPPSGPRPIRPKSRRSLKVLKPEWLEDSFTYEEFLSRPFPQHPAPPPVPPPVTTQPDMVNKEPAYYSPGSRIPILDRRRKQRPVLDVEQPTINMAAHSIQDKAAQVERSRRKPKIVRAAPQAVERGQGLEQPPVLPALTREEPLNRPGEALGQALCLLQDEEWERKTEGLRLVRALAQHHVDVVLPELHSVSTAVIEEIKNLRTLVSRDAIYTMAHLFHHLQHSMDSEVEGAARTLLHKAGEASLFIKEGVELALSMMVHSCSPGRVLRGLLAGGFRHRNPATRAATALCLNRLVHVMGASRVLKGRTFTSKILPAISTLAFDAAQEVRTPARAALRFLGGHREAAAAVEKFISIRDQASVKKLLLN